MMKEEPPQGQAARNMCRKFLGILRSAAPVGCHLGSRVEDESRFVFQVGHTLIKVFFLRHLLFGLD